MKFKKLLASMLALSISPLCILGIGASADEADYIGSYHKELTSGADIRIMTYNLLADNSEGGFGWGTPLGDRAEHAIDCMRYYMPDIIGIQEATVAWYTAIKARNSATYAFVNPDVGTSKYYNCTGIMYNRRTMKFVESELIKYSQGDNSRARFMNIAVLRHAATAETVVFVCTHFNAGESAADVRELQATELAAKLNEYAEKYKCPIISVADYNSKKGTEEQRIIIEEGHMAYSDAAPAATIDHILYRGAVTPKYFAHVDDQWIKSASDHLPMFTDFALDNKPTANGDIDEDGEVTVSDALRALRMSAKIETPTDREFIIANLDGDRKITVSDALEILRRAVRLA